MSSSVFFQNADIKLVFKEKAKLKVFIPLLFTEYGFTLDSLSIVFCSDDYLLNLNRQFLQHDYYTDILTFDLSTDRTVNGEIYISIDRVKENASNENVTFSDELLRIIFHGTLHLCGLEDKTISQKRRMTEKENEALQKFASFHVKQQE